MDKFSLICDLIIAICGFIPTIVSIVLLVRNIIKNKNWKIIEPIIRAAMSAAEEYAKEHPEMTGEDKLNMAIASIKSGCEAAGIKFDDELLKQIVAYINELCSWSKTVNKD